MKIVVRLGGSILGSRPNADVVKRYSDAVSRILKARHDVVVVVGGGAVAREYIEIARKIGLRRDEQDSIAIQASRLNARLVGMAMGSDEISTTLKGVVSAVKERHIAVMGGLRPGITTDTVATLVAEAWKADLIVKASDQEGIYTADPQKHPNAELLRNVSYEKLVEILGGRHSPGIHSIIDPVAVQHVARSRLRLIVVKGDDPENLLRAIKGKKVGTRVG